MVHRIYRPSQIHSLAERGQASRERVSSHIPSRFTVLLFLLLLLSQIAAVHSLSVIKLKQFMAIIKRRSQQVAGSNTFSGKMSPLYAAEPKII